MNPTAEIEDRTSTAEATPRYDRMVPLLIAAYIPDRDGSETAQPVAFSPGGTPAAATTSLRQGLLRDAPSLQAEIDCAELASAAGMTDAARLLYGVAFLRLGFAPAHLRWQRAVAGRNGLWSAAALREWGGDEDTPAGFCVDIAIAELKRMLGEQRDAFVAPSRRGSGADATGSIISPCPAGDLAAMSEALCRALRAPRGSETIAALAALLDRLGADILDASVPDVMADSDDIAQLVRGFAFRSLHYFLQAVRPFAYGLCGSADILYAVARLDPAGLGAYCGNVPRLIRRDSDIVGLIRAASPGTIDQEELERWVILLSTHLDGPRRRALMDDLRAERDRRLTVPAQGIGPT